MSSFLNRNAIDLAPQPGMDHEIETRFLRSLYPESVTWVMEEVTDDSNEKSEHVYVCKRANTVS